MNIKTVSVRGGYNLVRSSEPAVLEDAAHDPAVLAAASAQLQHAVVDVVGGPLVVLVRSHVQLRHLEDAQVAPGHRQRFLQPVARLDRETHTCFTALFPGLPG